MYDIAYEVEASLAVADLERSRIWEGLTKTVQSIGLLVEHMKLARLSSVKVYCLLMYIYNIHNL